MAENVSVEGFKVPGAPADAIQHSRETPPPASEQNPGWVANPNSVPPVPASAQQAQAPAVDPAMQAMMQSMIAQAAQQGPAPAPAQPVTGLNSIDPASIDDPVLRSMAGIFLNSSQGIDIDRAMGKALATGDASLIDFAHISEKGGQNAAHLAELAKSIVSHVQAQAKQAESAVHELAGGADGWNAAATAFNQVAPQHLKMVVSQMLDSGKIEAVKAAAQMVVEYARNSGVVPTPGKFIQTGASAAGSAQALDKLQFQAELQKLDRNSRTFEQDRAALFQRRQIGKQQGL